MKKDLEQWSFVAEAMLDPKCFKTVCSMLRLFCGAACNSFWWFFCLLVFLSVSVHLLVTPFEVLQKQPWVTNKKRSKHIKKVKKNTVYYNKRHHANSWGKPLFQATKQQLNSEKWDVGHLSALGSAVLLFRCPVFGRLLPWQWHVMKWVCCNEYYMM